MAITQFKAEMGLAVGATVAAEKGKHHAQTLNAHIFEINSHETVQKRWRSKKKRNMRNKSAYNNKRNKGNNVRMQTFAKSKNI